MKLLFGTLILGATASVFAQDAPPTPAAPAMPARVAILPAVGADVIVAGVTKNAPFTADESGESVRVMPDGNRIVENWSGKIARNSLGYIHRNVTSGKVGSGAARPYIFGGGMAASPAVVALGTGDGAMHVNMMAKIEAETAAAGARTIVASPSNGEGISVITTTGNGDDAKRVLLNKIEATAARGGTWVAADGTGKTAVESGVLSVAGARRAEEGKSHTRKESLGTRDFGGVQADGHRVITTYAPGAVGNEREIEVTSEVWFAKDLGVIVYSKRSDPRTGETTYQMTNIVRAEPDASLFPGHK
jgi:hypothetical protein